MTSEYEEDFYGLWPNIVMAAIVGHVTKTIFINICPSSKEGSTLKLALICQGVSEKIFENNGHIHVYSSRAGADKPLGSDFFSKNLQFLSI